MREAVLEGASRAVSNEATVPRKNMNVLAYVHLRNIHQSTGAGRVARQMIEHFVLQPGVHLQVLADPADHARIVPLVGRPWNQFAYHFLQAETSRQQAKWFLLNGPKAESYWPETQIIYCTGESYVPTKRARLVVTLHDAAYLEKQAHRRDRSFYLQRLKWNFLYRKLVRHADLFHTVSHFSAERLVHFFPELRNRVRVIPNAVTPHFFAPVTSLGEDYLAAVGLQNRAFVLVPGGLHFRKNADLILDAWPAIARRYPELTLAIVNHSHPEYAARASVISPSIKLLGFVSDEALRALYAAAQLVWFPSRYEGFGLPVVEAMACGAAVVASNASSLPEIAGDAALLAEATSSAKHVEAVVDVLSNDSLRSELQKRGSQRAALFTWDRSARQLQDAFEELL